MRDLTTPARKKIRTSQKANYYQSPPSLADDEDEENADEEIRPRKRTRNRVESHNYETTDLPLAENVNRQRHFNSAAENGNGGKTLLQLFIVYE